MENTEKLTKAEIEWAKGNTTPNVLLDEHQWNILSKISRGLQYWDHYGGQRWRDTSCLSYLDRMSVLVFRLDPYNTFYDKNI